MDYYQLFLPHDDRPHGFVLPENVHRMPWSEDFDIDHDKQIVKLTDTSDGKDSSSTCNAAFAKIVDEAIKQDTFDVIHGQHSELMPIIGAKYPVSIERFATDLFGIVTRGAHLTMYTTGDDGTMRIWVPRRSPTMFTFPNKLDTTVAGGVPSHQTPLENIIQEADEEASLSADLIKKDVRAVGALTYMGYSADANGSKERLIAPDCVYVFDLEAGPDVKPIPKDGEVKEFNLMGVGEVKDALARGEFKTNSAVVMLDFFVRHGILTPENEPNYVEIVTRMHRRLPFPTTA